MNTTLKRINQKLRKSRFIYLSFIILVLSCQDNKNVNSNIILENEDCIYYNLIVETKFPTNYARTYCFMRNNNFYEFSYYKNEKQSKRGTFKEDFDFPVKWRLEGDSLFLDDKSFKIIKRKDDILLERKHQKLILKRFTGDFEIEFYTRGTKMYIQNAKGDTINTFDITNK